MEWTQLVLEGAHMYGFAYVGVIRALEKAGRVQSLHTFGGTGTGALVACLVGLGFSSQEIEQAFSGFQLLGHPSWIGRLARAWRLLFRYGLLSSGPLRRRIETLVATKWDRNVTFRDVKEGTGRLLYVTVSDLVQKRPVYCSYEATPTMRIVDALVATCSTPLVYPPVLDPPPAPDEWGEYGAHVYVDGVLYNNFPVHVCSAPAEALGVQIDTPLESHPVRFQHLGSYVQTCLLNILEGWGCAEGADSLHTLVRVPVTTQDISTLIQQGQTAMENALL
jgi:predicted acylesterase/phospholipase RssA